MKTKLIFSLVLFLIIVVFLFTKPSAELTNTGFFSSSGGFSDSFLITAMSLGESDNYSIYDSMNFNLWHSYPMWFLGNPNNGWVIHVPGDTLYAPIEAYKDEILNLLNNNNSRGMRTLMDRVKIYYLCNGQRSDYQCEREHQDTDLWFYTYNTSVINLNVTDIIDNSIYGQGAKVKYCQKEPENPEAWSGYIVKDLKSNREQILSFIINHPFQIDKNYKWYIKPRIRIDSAVVDNNPELNVCRVEILDFNGSVVKSVILKAKNFRDGSNNYDGRYIEEYRYFPGDDSLIIPGVLFNPGDSAYGNENCKVDFRVWWYGNCDMWIDYVRVDNEVAHRLLKGNDRVFELWLKWEVQDLAMQSASPVNFFMEEFFFNNIPCMAYVSRKIDSLSNGRFNLSAIFPISHLVSHMPNWWDRRLHVDFIIRQVINKLSSRESFSYSYPLRPYYMGHWFYNHPKNRYIPNTLPFHTYDTTKGILARDTTPAGYDSWLQWHFDEKDIVTYPDSTFTYIMKMADSISKVKDIPVINMTQTHLWISGDEKLSEPTNEELDLMVHLAISYGAKGILYFWWAS